MDSSASPYDAYKLAALALCLNPNQQGSQRCPRGSSAKIRQNLHIDLHTFTETQINLLYLLLFGVKRNALKIRRP